MARSNKAPRPGAKDAPDRFRMEAANEVGVNLKQGCNGDLTSKQAGSVDGQMAGVMCPVRQMQFYRTDRTAEHHKITITYEYALAI